MWARRHIAAEVRKKWGNAQARVFAINLKLIETEKSAVTEAERVEKILETGCQLQQDGLYSNLRSVASCVI